MRTVRLFVAGLFPMLVGSTAWASACDGFTDVDDGDTSYCIAVTYLKDKGITLGCTGTTYCPNDYVTRLQMALFLQRMGRGSTTNVLADWTDAIGGGESNTTAIGAGHHNVIGGGEENTASGGWSTISGGQVNLATGDTSFVGGGLSNTASGPFSTVPGGISNTASGGFSFAAGKNADANSDGCFVWGDGSTANLVRCDAANRFVVRSLGGIFMFAGGSDQASYTGVVLPPGGSAWVVGSDRNGKEEFAPVDANEVLRKVVALPISTWKWKNQHASIRHMGPMAQDFSAAFELGESPKGISTVDADGVALAAIQGLNSKVEARDAIIGELSRELVEIKAQLAVLAAAH